MSSLYSKLSSRLSSSAEDSSSSSPKDAKASSSRRREQVRRAQKTHRERRAKYLQGLEYEVTHLRAKVAQSTVQLRQCQTVNQRLTALLQANNILVPPEVYIVPEADYGTNFEVLGTSGATHLLQTSTSTAPGGPGSWIDLNDPHVAIEFVLTLEQPCLDHLHSYRGEDNELGHKFQLQTAAIEVGPQGDRPAAGQRLQSNAGWTIPKAELEEQLQRLHNTAQRLNLDGELTPVMCWARLKENVGSNKLAHALYQQILQELATEMVCYGFGISILEPAFEIILARVLG